jgi:hypothetical protein
MDRFVLWEQLYDLFVGIASEKDQLNLKLTAFFDFS